MAESDLKDVQRDNERMATAIRQIREAFAGSPAGIDKAPLDLVPSLLARHCKQKGS